ncbi:MAG: 50S ribosomal protein L4 [Bacilli bacterium]|nr:50S ribosomal protein L4 [Bacilli bacterium]
MAEKKTLTVAVLDKTGNEVSKIKLNAEVFGIEPNNQVMFDAVQVEQSNSRQATAKTKVRHEVSGGGKKPYRQKGTGRARAGSSRSPIWVGGGTVFGPVGNQNYKISQNKKSHNLALRSALSLKAKDGMVVVDDLKLESKKTKEFLGVMDALKVGAKALVVLDALEDENVLYGASNVNWVKLVTTDNVSVLDLLNVDSVVFTKSSVENLQKEVLK